MQKPDRLSLVCKAFVAVVVAMGADAVKAVLRTLAACVGPVTGTRVADGRTFERRNVDLSALLTLGGGLGRDGKELWQRFEQECAKRGNPWAEDCGHLVIAEHLVTPLKAALAKFEGALSDGMGAKVADLSARIAALEAAGAPKSEPIQQGATG